MKYLKSLLLILFGVSNMLPLAAQWNTSGNHIYNTNSGNVGIGTSSPSSKLSLGTAGTSEIGSQFLLYDAGSASDGNNFGLAMDPNTGRFSFSAGTSGYFSFHTADRTERMRIISNGNVGIGTSGPSALLHIVNGTASTTNLKLKLAASQTADAFQVLDNSDNKIVTITKDGSLSIIKPGGQYLTTPTAMLDIQSQNSDFIRAYDHGTTSLLFRLAANGSLWFGANLTFDAGNNRLNASTIYTTDNSVMPSISAALGTADIRLNRDGFSGGNVLIGYDASQGVSYRLQVKGKALISGGLDVIGVGAPEAVVASIKGVTSQTGNLLQWQNVGGSVLSSVTADGSFLIGTTHEVANYKLAVGGSIIAQKVKVLLQSNWPDYVFEKNYHLVPLAELERYINDNGHLPGLPSSAEVEKNGIDLGDNQAALLEKIEELTLHLIEMDKRIDRLAAENEMLKKRFTIPKNK